MRQAKTERLSLPLYILAFLLFWEWLRPLPFISDVQHVHFFIGFAAFSFFLSYLRLPAWLTFSAKLLAMLAALHALFVFHAPLFHPLWLVYLIDDVKENLAFVFSGDWVSFTDSFRTLLFFILLWITGFLMHHWLIRMRKLFLFFFLTVIYLAVLDAFTAYRAEGAIVRTVIIGLVLLGLLRVLNVQERENVTFGAKILPASWIGALAAMIAFATTVGYAAPKAGPQWPDPVPFIKSAAYGGDGGTSANLGAGVQWIGYDGDDRHLGGAFRMDPTPVFETTGEHSHYWRVEAKRVYTGKGWTESDNAKSVRVDGAHLAGTPILSLYEKGTQVEHSVDRVQVLGDDFPQIIYGGTVTKVARADDVNQFRLNEETGKLEPLAKGHPVTVKTYAVTYQYPVFSIPKLKSVTGGDPKDIKAKYLQLPPQLPKRVQRLAEALTENANNRYDKVNAIVNFLHSGDFEYNTVDVPKPGRNEDYVDQFLFETKRGYCDNFSTAMVVLLRSVGIPARWVKGFTQGEYEETVADDGYKFIVRNSDAHSWPEVYFPGSGWVPFEPTKGFDNIAQFTFADSSDHRASAPAAPKKTEKKAPKQDKTQNEVKKSGAGSHRTTLDIGFLLKIAGAIALFAILAAAVLFQTRRKWLPGYLLRHFRKRSDGAALEDAFKWLMRLLALHGFRRRDGQTLREFAAVVDRALGGGDLRAFALIYERKRYYRPSPELWQQSKQFWENIIINLRG